MVDLSGAGHEVSFLDETLGQRDGFGNGVAEVGIEIVDLDLIGAETGHDRSPAGIAEGELVVGAIKANTTGGKAIDVGSFDDKVPVAPERGSEVIDRYEEDVGFLGRKGGAEREEKEESPDHWDSFDGLERKARKKSFRAGGGTSLTRLFFKASFADGCEDPSLFCFVGLGCLCRR